VAVEKAQARVDASLSRSLDLDRPIALLGQILPPIELSPVDPGRGGNGLAAPT